MEVYVRICLWCREAHDLLSVACCLCIVPVHCACCLFPVHCACALCLLPVACCLCIVPVACCLLPVHCACALCLLPVSCALCLLPVACALCLCIVPAACCLCIVPVHCACCLCIVPVHCACCLLPVHCASLGPPVFSYSIHTNEAITLGRSCMRTHTQTEAQTLRWLGVMPVPKTSFILPFSTGSCVAGRPRAAAMPSMVTGFSQKTM